MAQILYMLVDKINEDPYADSQSYKRGDVVSVRDDDDNPYEKDPGISERLGSMFGVLRVPGKAPDYSAFTVSEVGDPKQNRVLQRRAFKLDLEFIDSKSVPVKDNVKQISKADDVFQAKISKEPLSDPGVIDNDVKFGVP